MAGRGKRREGQRVYRFVCQITELSGLAQKVPQRYTYCVPGAERMGPSWWQDWLQEATNLTAPRLVDARSGNKDISGKSRGWTVAGSVSGREPSVQG